MQNNVIGVCKDCKDQEHAAFQANLEPNLALIQSLLPDPVFIKTGFPVTENKNEYMWVKVSAFEESKGVFIGSIDNEPVSTKVVKFGDVVEVKYEDITNGLYEKDGKLEFI